MRGEKLTGFNSNFSDDDSCLEWLKNRIYPQGIVCPACRRVTKHHKISKRHCYACDVCRHQVYPTAGTIFHKTTLPLKTWFEVIRKILNSKAPISLKDIQREFGVTGQTAQRLVQKIEGSFYENRSANSPEVKVQALNRALLSLKDSTSAKVEKEANIKKRKNPVRPLFSSQGINRHEITHEMQQKRDRTARLLKLQILLWQHPQGLTTGELANRCSISKRTVYRDLRALESELGVPIWEKEEKRGIVEGYYLPPISFTVDEANNIFFAARLMQQISPGYDANFISTLMKLNTIVSVPIQTQIRNTLDYMEGQPRDSRIVSNFNKLVQAWLSHRKVRITYQNLVDQEAPVERIIEPYFIEPSIIGSSSYVIAFCHLRKTIYAFAISFIIGDVMILTDTFEIPDDFSAINYLSEAWGVYSETKQIETVKLLFKPSISKSILDLKLHPSQKTEVQVDGSVIFTLKVRDTIQFFGWILAWRDKVEVLEPETMRDEISVVAKSLWNKYQSHKTKALS